MWYIQTMEHYSVTRKDEVLPFATTWVGLEIIMLSETSQTEKAKNHMIHSYVSYLTEGNKPTNKTNKNVQVQTTERWLPEGRGWWENEEGKEGQIHGDERRLDFG